MRIGCLATVLVFTFFSTYSWSQESMLPSVSNDYLKTLVEYAKMNYPKTKRYRAKIDQTQYGINRARVGYFDALTFSLTFNQASNSTNQTNPKTFIGTGQSGLFINIGTLLSKGPSLKIAKTEKTMAEEELAEVYLNIEALVKERYYYYIQKLTVLKIRSKYVEDAEASFKLVKYKFEKGEENFDNYTKALLLNSVSIQNKVESEGDVLTAKAHLEELLGKKLEEVR